MGCFGTGPESFYRPYALFQHDAQVHGVEQRYDLPGAVDVLKGATPLRGLFLDNGP